MKTEVQEPDLNTCPQCGVGLKPYRVNNRLAGKYCPNRQCNYNEPLATPAKPLNSSQPSTQ